MKVIVNPQTVILSFVFLISYFSHGQQLPDTSCTFNILHPAYKSGKGPIIGIDEGHNNVHTAGGSYSPLKKLLENDGYRVVGFPDILTKESLSGCRILITANPLNERNIREWMLPNPSAFTGEEIMVLKDWVRDGGRLFIITDHMPCAGAVEALAKAFGFEIRNGFAIRPDGGDHVSFKAGCGGLAINPVTLGRNFKEKIDSVATFTGCAFRIPCNAESVITFKGNFVSVLPDTAWRTDKVFPVIPINGWSQGAVLRYGRGRVALFGEAGMFTAQVAGEKKAGFNTPEGSQNAQLSLNIIHWLDGVIR